MIKIGHAVIITVSQVENYCSAIIFQQLHFDLGVSMPVDLREIERIIKDNLEFLLNAREQEKGKHVNG